MRSLKTRALDLFATTMFGLGVSHPRRIAPGQLLILTFHRVLPEAIRSRYPLPGLVVTPEELRWIVATLRPYFEIDTVSANSERQSRSIGERPLLSITFDDGQVDNVEYAAAVLAELGVTATFYLPTDFIGGTKLLWHDEVAFAWRSQQLTSADRQEVLRQAGLTSPTGHEAIGAARLLALLKQLPAASRATLVGWLTAKADGGTPDWARLMSWDDARALAGAGHEIGSHCRSHELLPQLSVIEQAHELQGSSAVIADAAALGKTPRSVCYPNGDSDAETLRLSREAGYENGVTTRWGINTPRQDRFELLRCDMDARRLRSADRTLSAARLAVRVLGHQPGLR